MIKPERKGVLLFSLKIPLQPSESNLTNVATFKDNGWSNIKFLVSNKPVGLKRVICTKKQKQNFILAKAKFEYQEEEASPAIF